MLILPLILLILSTTQALSSPASCSPTDFPVALSRVICRNFTRAKKLPSPEACQEICCNVTACDTWQFCNSSTGCGIQQLGTQLGMNPGDCFYGAHSPSADCVQSKKDGWVGAARVPVPVPVPTPHPHPTPSPKPTPVPPPHRSWNLQPGLIPEKGMWRGSTLDRRFYGEQSFYAAFQKQYGHRLHIFRTFKTDKWKVITDDEKAFVEGGGILFYSIMPKPWSDWGATGTKQESIREFANVIKALAPAQVMVAPGYEPDGHAAESQNKTGQVYGKAAEYAAMYRNFRKTFANNNVSNAVFVLDLSCAVKDHAFVLDELYPGDESVDWMFFNLFQSHNQEGPKDGNCTTMARELYATLSAGGKYDSKPWGVGAWGTMNSTFGDPPKWPSKAIPAADRAECLQQMETVLAADKGDFPKLKAAIYFNSLNSMISPDPTVPYASPELAPELQKMYDLDAFTVNDNDTAV